MSHPHPGLTAPPSLASDALRVTPLGGLGEIGRNMTAFEHQGRLLVVEQAPARAAGERDRRGSPAGGAGLTAIGGGDR